MFKFSKTQNVPSSPTLYCQRLEIVVWLSPWKVGLPSRNYFHQPPTWYPDLVTECEKILLVELTVCCEENIESAHVRKRDRYEDLKKSINDSTEWHSTVFPIEVGARGFVGRSTSHFYRKIGLTSQSASKLCKSLSLVAARCSYNLWLHRENKKWKMGPLLTPNAPDTKSSGVGLARHA